MAGGLMQLVAYGAQDIYLTGNPQITFFKVVYRRHTNFAVEAIEQTFNGAADLGRRFTCTIARNGDLLHRLYLQLDVSAASSAFGPQYLGFQLLDYVEVEIGGQVIDKQYGEWMAVWCDLTHTYDQSLMLASMVDATNTTATVLDRLHIPLQFWFCRNPGLALPLIALQYHEVKINVQFVSSMPSLTAIGSNTLQNTTVWADYIFLDTDERRRFAQVSHEYLIEQVQFSNALSIGQANATSSQHELRFNHPVKELIWLVDNSNNFSDFTSYIACSDALLQLNGQDRFKRRSGDYFIKVQRYEHHSGCGRALNSTDTTSTENENPVLSATHVYSFALKPEEHQPSGTCNFSRIDNAILNLSFSTSNTVAGNMNTTAVAASTVVKVYAVNYNVLRIMSGMGGLAYSN
jgi:hypothetical protein